VIKAVIFDCFGVLTTEGFKVFCDKYFQSDPAKRAEATALMDSHTLGKIDYDTFSKELAALASVNRETIFEYLEGNKPNELLFDYIRTKLKPKYKIGFLSNTGADRIDEIFTPQQIALLDDIVQSYRLGLNKPDPKIYQVAANNLGVKPEECVMVDDSRRSYEGAQKAGMQVVFYQTFDQMKTDLEKLLASGSNN